MRNPQTKADLLERVKELEEENESLQTQLDQVADIVAPYDDDDDSGDDDGDDSDDEDGDDGED